IANSTRISGTDHSSRNTTQATRNDPPPFVAATRGKRQMLPVPTAMPSMATIIPQRVENCSTRSDNAVLLVSRVVTASDDAVSDELHDSGRADPLLLQRVTVPHRHRVGRRALA